MDPESEATSTQPSASGVPSRWPVLVAALAGVAAGIAGRHVPEQVALAVFDATAPATEEAGCSMERTLECALEALPSAVGALFLFGLVLLAVSVVAFAAGCVLLLVAALRRRRAGRRRGEAASGEPGDGAPPAGADRVTMALVFVGSAMVVPPAWLAVSLALG